MRRAAGDAQAKVTQRAYGFWATNAIRLQARVFLVIDHASVGGGAEMPINTVGVESEVVKLLLQLANVIPHHHIRRLEIQHPHT